MKEKNIEILKQVKLYLIYRHRNDQKSFPEGYPSKYRSHQSTVNHKEFTMTPPTKGYREVFKFMGITANCTSSHPTP